MATAGALVVVDKQLGGETWSNTYGIGLGAGPYSLQPTDPDMIAFGAGGDFSSAGVVTPGGAVLDVLHSILYFERRIHDDQVQFTRVYVTDGKKNFLPGGGEVINSYFTASLGWNGVVVLGTGNALLSGLVALMVAKNPVGFSARRGRWFYRLCLMSTEIKAEAFGLVDWLDAAAKTTVTGRITTAWNDALMNTHCAGGANVAGGVLLVPKFSRYVPAVGESPPTGGEMIGGTALKDMAVIGPKGRQVRRGRKRPALG